MGKRQEEDLMRVCFGEGCAGGVGSSLSSCFGDADVVICAESDAASPPPPAGVTDPDLEQRLGTVAAMGSLRKRVSCGERL